MPGLFVLFTNCLDCDRNILHKLSLLCIKIKDKLLLLLLLLLLNVVWLNNIIDFVHVDIYDVLMFVNHLKILHL